MSDLRSKLEDLLDELGRVFGFGVPEVPDSISYGVYVARVKLRTILDERDEESRTVRLRVLDGSDVERTCSTCRFKVEISTAGGRFTVCSFHNTELVFDLALNGLSEETSGCTWHEEVAK